MKLYIGCGLTQAPEDFKNKIEEIKKTLRKDFEVFDFLGTKVGSPSDVYKKDIKECLAKCDAFIAICDFPAIGLGYELGVAVEKLGKPTLALAQKDALVTRLVLGIDSPNYKFVRYGTVKEIPELVKKFIAK